MDEDFKELLDTKLPVGISIIKKSGEVEVIGSLLAEILDYNDSDDILENTIYNDIIKKVKTMHCYQCSKTNDNKVYKIEVAELKYKYVISVIDASLFMDNQDEFNLIKYSLDKVTIPILWVSKNGDIIYSNKNNDLDSNNIPNGDFIGKTITDITNGDIDRVKWDNFWSNINYDNTYTSLYEHYCKDTGKISTLKIIAHKVYYNKTDYCYMVIDDVSELINMNNKLLKEKDKASESDRLKSAFLSNMSHEFRTPMNAIVGFSDVLNQLLGGRYKEYTNIISNNVYDLLAAVENIITLSKIDSEETKINHNEFDIYQVFIRLNTQYREKIIKSNKDIKLIFESPINQKIDSDEYLIEDMMVTLLDNAIKFTDNGTIRFGYDIQDDNIIFYVSDTGIGIENKYHDVIFDRFKQINSLKNGSGLGLSIFKSYASILGSKIAIDSEIGEGTTISFDLNVDFIDKTDDNTHIEFIKLNGLKILVVDDVLINQILLYEVLTPYGVDVIKAMDGEEAVNKLLEIRDIDLILMDIEMPIMNGYEATKIIREFDKVIPIIAQTAHTERELRERAIRNGFTDFIKKPILNIELLEKIIKNLS